MSGPNMAPLIAIACGGTGGHLFPGLAVAGVLQQWGCDVALLISRKEVDQEAVKAAGAAHILSLPAVALQDGRWTSFFRGFWQSYRLCRNSFKNLRPRGVLAMGGFTSAPPVLAGKAFGALTFLHESNAVPGRANRWLSPWVDEVFIGFPPAARRLYNQAIRHIGTPVRAQFRPADHGSCRMALGLDASRPVLLIMGGSQGAHGINVLLREAIPILAAQAPELQYVHLTGAEDHLAIRAAYAAHQRRATVRPFLTEMELALGAATLAINRAGASSLSELAAMRLPAILVPYPHATDNHQFYNARALADTGAARMIEQASTSAENIARSVLELLASASSRGTMQRALDQWHFPHAAADIAQEIFKRLGLPKPELLRDEESQPDMPLRAHAARKWSGSGHKFQIASSKSK